MEGNKFKEKKIEAEILGDLYDTVDSRERAARQDYRVIQKDGKQATDWKTGELLWLDEAKTIPKMENVYGTVEKTDEELTDDDRMRIKVCQRIKAALEKML
jgi:hypothetical protein